LVKLIAIIIIMPSEICTDIGLLAWVGMIALGVLAASRL